MSNVELANSIGQAVVAVLAPAADQVAEVLNSRNSKEDITGIEILQAFERAISGKPAPPTKKKAEPKKAADTKAADESAKTCAHKGYRKKNPCGKPATTEVGGVPMCDECVKAAEAPKENGEKKKSAAKSKKPAAPFTDVKKGDDAESASEKSDDDKSEESKEEKSKEEKPKPKKVTKEEAPKEETPKKKAAAKKEATPKKESPKEDTPKKEKKPAAKKESTPKNEDDTEDTKKEDTPKAAQKLTATNLLQRIQSGKVGAEAKSADVDELIATAKPSAKPKAPAKTAKKPAAVKETKEESGSDSE